MGKTIFKGFVPVNDPMLMGGPQIFSPSRPISAPCRASNRRRPQAVQALQRRCRRVSPFQPGQRGEYRGIPSTGEQVAVAVGRQSRCEPASDRVLGLNQGGAG